MIVCNDRITERRRIVVCHVCNREISRGSTDQDARGIVVCAGCRSQFVSCGNCGCFHDRSTERSRMGLCPLCYDERAPQYMIRGHDYKPAPVFHPDYEEGTRYAGVEIEMDRVPGETISLKKFCTGVKNYDGHLLYLKHDGSLSPDGVEIVSHPMTPDFHKSGVWYDVLNSARSAGYHSHDTQSCGLHVHINKDSLSLYGEERERIIGKITYLIHRFQPQIYRFSRRDVSRWAKFISWNIAGDYFDEYLQYKLVNHSDRYMALNLQNPRTIEFRMFRGTLNHDTLMASIELCDLLCDVGMMPFSRVRNVSWGDIKNIAGGYDYLPAYLLKRGVN